MKKILFIHQNFPGQFAHLVPALRHLGHDVCALTTESNRRPPLVRTLHYRFQPQPFQHNDWRIASHFSDQARRGEHAARAAMQLKKSGYYPDIVYGHPGWGETMFLADIWPDARHITYAEFFYRASGQDVGFDPEFSGRSEQQAMAVRARQASQLLAMETAHQAISPTHWQASTYPRHIRRKIKVVHDGIDTKAIRPDPGAIIALPDGALHLRQGDEVLTFVSRNLEPYRGFHIFMRALPRILRARPNVRVIIVGGDGQSYGGPPPCHSSWREHLLAELCGELDLARVHFVGKIPYPSFVSLMQISRVHSYLTYPFVLSWSLLEAMSAGALIVGSRTAPVQEVITDGDNGLLVDFFDIQELAETIIRALREPQLFAELKIRARQLIETRFDLRDICLPLQIDLLEAN